MYEKNIDLYRTGMLHRCTRAYEKQKYRALRVIDVALMNGDKFYASISGGKDSVALLSMLMQSDAGKGDLWAHVSDASFPGTVETIKKCAEISGWNLFLDESPVSAFDVVGKQSSQQFGKKGYFFDAIKKFTKEGGYKINFTGVRAAESARRTKAFKVHGHMFKTSVPCPVTRCDAIAHFRIEDVAAAIVESGLPIHPIYEKAPLGERCIRLGYATSLDLIESTASFLKKNYPDLFVKLCRAYPETRKFI